MNAVLKPVTGAAAPTAQPVVVDACPQAPVVPGGFEFAGLHTGVKRSRPDLGVIACARSTVAAGVYTQNPVRAACVARNATLTPRFVRAVVVNSGNANAMTGPGGARDNVALARAGARLVSAQVDDVLTCSTGVIGVPLPADRIIVGIQNAQPGRQRVDARAFERAILTTDTGSKSATAAVEIAPGEVAHLYGVAKGSGMIHPNMATTLGFVCTDVAIDSALLDAMLRTHITTTFNAITVDGDTSTNDTVLVLASGQGPDVREGPRARRLSAGLAAVLRSLARQVAADGEGATRLLEVVVRGAPSIAVAHTVARTVAGSPLFKCSAFAAAPGFGRFAAAVGRAMHAAGVGIVDPDLRISAQGITVVDRGRVVPLADARAQSLLARLDRAEVRWEVDLGLGPASFTAWGCDLSYDYVRINAKYGADGPRASAYTSDTFVPGEVRARAS